MATWFSNPIDWQASMKLSVQTDNSMNVWTDKGPIVMKALFDGFLVYRKTSAAPQPEAGNLELVLMPDRWSDEMQKFFNPGHPEKGIRSRFSELPPGRVVYRSIARSVIETALHDLIFSNFEKWLVTPAHRHRSLEFVPKSADSFGILKYKLKELWEKGVTPDEKKKLVDEEIKKALDEVFAQSAGDTLVHGLPIQGGDVLASIGKDVPVELVFDIRNFYGEPLNPHFYLRKLERTAGELTPPPFKADDNQAPRIKESGEYLAIRIPSNGGAEFQLMKDAAGNSYKSPMIWTHTFNATTGSHTTKLEKRPGQNPTIPTLNTSVEGRVNNIWDNGDNNSLINKYAEFFSCPCEVIVATIYKESRPGAGNIGDLHSMRFETIPEKGAFAIDHEDLLDQSKKTGSKLTKASLKAYWDLAGMWRTNPDKPSYEAETKDKLPPTPKLEPAIFPIDPTTKIGSDSASKKISWQQIDEIDIVKPLLIKRQDFVLPPLAKAADGKTHYQLIKDKSGLGEVVAKLYYQNVGGIGLNDKGEEVPKSVPAAPLPTYPLPLAKYKDSKIFTDPADTRKFVTWEQLLNVLALLKSNGVAATAIPKSVYLLQPFEKIDDFDFHARFTVPLLKAKLGLTTDAQARDVIDRYIKLATKGLVFLADVGTTPPAEGVKEEGNPSSTHLTLKETKAFSEIYPHRISIGIGQCLLDTASRRIITWIREVYTNKFFTDLGLDIPSTDPAAQIPWIWTNLWSSRELQIAFIAAYHKQNATAHWQSVGKDSGYKVGERMTMFDFPRSGASYNAGAVKKAETANDDSIWGMVTFGGYQTLFWSAIVAAVKKFDSIPSTDPKWARVRLRPDLNTNSGMDAR
jgi:hypothetical protein